MKPDPYPSTLNSTVISPFTLLTPSTYPHIGVGVRRERIASRDENDEGEIGRG